MRDARNQSRLQHEEFDVDLAHLIDQGVATVSACPKHDLPLAFRFRVWRAMDRGDVVQFREQGHKRRVELSYVAIEKTLPIWSAQYCSSDTPIRALHLVRQLQRNAIAEEYAKAECGRLWNHCDDLSYRFPKDTAIAVGYGAIQTIWQQLSDDHFNYRDLSGDIKDVEMDPYHHDPSFCAAIAYADGVPWKSTSNALKRQEFWNWWLTTAVPNAAKVE